MFGKKQSPVVPDMELDIETLPIRAIERIEGQTVLAFMTMKDGLTVWQEYDFQATIEQHNRLVARFRKKLRIE